MRAVVSVLVMFAVSMLPMVGIAGEIALGISEDRATKGLLPANVVSSVIDSLDQIRANDGLESLRYDSSRSEIIQSGYLKSDQMGAMLKAQSPMHVNLKAYLTDINNASFRCVGSSVEEIMTSLLSVREFRDALADSAYNVVVLSAITDTSRNVYVLASLVKRLIEIEKIRIVADESGLVSLALTGCAPNAENLRISYSKASVEAEEICGSEIGKPDMTIEPDGSFRATLSLSEYGPGVYSILVEVLTKGAAQYVPADSFEIEVAGTY